MLLFHLGKELKNGSLKTPDGIEDIAKLFNQLAHIPWVVNSQPPGKGKKKPVNIVRYLSRYVAKSAVSDKRIQKAENGNVYIRYYNRKRKQSKMEVVTEIQFMKRLVLHILPKGFKKSGSSVLWQTVTGQTILPFAGCFPVSPWRSSMS